jgi:hypothetical protein
MEDFKVNIYYIVIGFFLGGIPMIISGIISSNNIDVIIGCIYIVMAVGLGIWLYRRARNRYSLESLKSAVKMSKATWGLWQSGGQALENRILKPNKETSIKKIMLLSPDKNNSIFDYITNLAGRIDSSGKDEEIREINRVTELAKCVKGNIDVYYHSEPLTYTFTIYDRTPEQSNNGELLPKSENAWVVIQPLEPKREHEKHKWHKWVRKNKGGDEEQFMAYYNLFLEIQNNRAEKVW